MWQQYALGLVVFSALAMSSSSLLQAQMPGKEKKVITIPLDPLAEFISADDLLAWVHTGSVKFGGTDPVVKIRVIKDQTTIVPKDNRHRESKLKLTDREIKKLQKKLLEDINLPHIAGPWFNGQANLWNGSQDCFLIQNDSQVFTLTCEYDWPSDSAHRDLMIQRYNKVMQVYVDLIFLVRAGGEPTVTSVIPLANQGLKNHLPDSDPLTFDDFTFGENLAQGHRRITFVRENTRKDGQREKVHVEVLVPDEGSPRLGSITINGTRFKPSSKVPMTIPTK